MPSAVARLAPLLVSCVGAVATYSFSIHGRAGGGGDDEIGHYLVARECGPDPAFVLNMWGRTVNTLCYILPAQFGIEWTRFTSLALLAVGCVFTIDLGRRLRIGPPALVAAFYWFQPWILTGAHCLTEVPFLTIQVVAFWGLAAGRYRFAGLMVGLLPLVRHEGIALAGLWGMVALVYRAWGAAVLIALPLVVQNVLYWAVFDTPAFLIFFQPKPTAAYGSGPWSHFFKLLPYRVGAVGGLAVYGLPLMLRSGLRVALAVHCGVYVTLHVVIFKFGLFASGGVVDFLVPIAPVVALAGALGCHVLAREVAGAAGRVGGAVARWATRPRVGWLLGAAAVGVAAITTRGAPTTQNPVSQAAGQAAAWIREQGLQNEPLEASHVTVFATLPYPVKDRVGLWSVHPRSEDMPVGTLVVWDSNYSEDSGLKRAELDGRPEWRSLARFVVKYGDEVHSAEVFQKVGGSGPGGR
jgi:hypothetical protein